MIESIIVYEFTEWTISKWNKRKRNKVEVECWKKGCCLTRLNVSRNKEIRGQAGAHINITETIEIKHFKWFGHLNKMLDLWWPQEKMELYTSTKKKTRHTKLSLRKSIKTAIISREFQEEDREKRKLWNAVDIARYRETPRYTCNDCIILSTVANKQRLIDAIVGQLLLSINQ